MGFLFRKRDEGIHEVSKADIMRGVGVSEDQIHPEDEKTLIFLTDKGIGERLQ
jgi:hypothetical protein